MSEQDTYDPLRLKEWIVKHKKCFHCKKDFTLHVVPEELLVCPHCAAVQLPCFHPFRLKEFIFQHGHPAHTRPSPTFDIPESWEKVKAEFPVLGDNTRLLDEQEIGNFDPGKQHHCHNGCATCSPGAIQGLI